MKSDASPEPDEGVTGVVDAPAPPAVPSLTPNALRVLRARYLRRDDRRAIIETPDELFARVARAVADAELRFGGPRDAVRWEEDFLRLMSTLDFLPNSPTLMNAGTEPGQLSACFVIPVDDSMDGIFDALKRMALVQRTGGGTGFSFSALRPAGALLGSTKGEASGPVSFMRIFDCATQHIKQGGRRRGANMGVLRVDHPDILAFVAAKRDQQVLENFNLSVGATDEFMQAVRTGDVYDLVDPQSGRCAGRLSARDVFTAIADAAWRSGDPGLLFLDAVNRANPTPSLGQVAATNPCGETPLLPCESCNLGSINLAHMVALRAGHHVVDWTRLDDVVRSAVRFLDDVIEVNRYPGDEFARAARATRKIGLGVMGFAEMLIRLGIPYASDAGIALGERVMRRVARAADRASRHLAAERGVFPAWETSTFAARRLPRRNATCTAIAPTGTISILAGTTASIEPVFALAYRRRHVLGEETLVELTPLLREYGERQGADVAALLPALAARGMLRDVPGVPPRMQALFATALEIPARSHLAMQAAFQRHTDNSVSKTVNLPHDATASDVADTYWSAWELGLKGVTVFRYGSRATQVLELGSGEEAFHYDHASRCDPTECRV
jgi:ribonucleoside-diphosphate reductase alpha chain